MAAAGTTGSARTRLAWVVRAALVACVAAAVAMPVLPARHFDLALCVVLGTAVTLTWVSVRRLQPEAVRDTWTLALVAITVLASGLPVEILEHRAGLVRGPRPSQLVLVAGLVLLVLGIARVGRSRRRGRATRRTWLQEPDVAIFALGALAPVLVLVVLPTLADPTFDGGGRGELGLRGMLDLGIILVLARLVYLRRRQQPTLVMFGAAILVALVGDLVAGFAGVANGPEAPEVARVLMLLAYVLAAAGFVHPSLEQVTRSWTWHGRATAAERRVWWLVAGQLAPAITLAVAWWRGDLRFVVVIAVVGLLVSALVAYRINALVRRVSEQAVMLAAQAGSDELTGLANRRTWNHELTQACASAHEQGLRVSVALLDLDLFKVFNDTHGHPAGDRLLRASATAWTEQLRPGDLLARYGGEEFAVLLPGLGAREALDVLDDLRRATPGGQTVSGGVAEWVHGTDPADTLAAADRALYEAKRAGRDRVLVADQGLVGPREPATTPPSPVRGAYAPVVLAAPSVAQRRPRAPRGTGWPSG